jgi:hypothetical protein
MSADSNAFFLGSRIGLMFGCVIEDTHLSFLAEIYLCQYRLSCRQYLLKDYPHDLSVGELLGHYGVWLAEEPQ